VAYVSILANPDDEVSLLRVINCPARGIGKTAMERVNRFSLDEEISLHDALGRAGQIPGLKAAKKALEFHALLQRYREKAKGERLYETFRSLLEEVGYQAEIERLYPDPLDQKSRLAIVQDVLESAAEYERREPAPSLSGFLQELALDDSRDWEEDESTDSVHLITLHSAKGLEFPMVFVAGVEEGLIPHRRSIDEDDPATIEEERRLFYVGITRARQELVLTVCRTRKQFGKQVPAEPSRFLSEIPEKLLVKTSADSGQPASQEVEKAYFDAIRTLLKKPS
jgi:DNA helicase-2/ATP-dependent DNA helicase PcrA